MSFQGSKPKKFWRKINYSNPTFKSSAMTSVLTNPQLYQYQHRPQKTLANNNSNIDSLQHAQNDFLAKKVQKTQNMSHVIIKPAEKAQLETFASKQIEGQKRSRKQFRSLSSNKNIESSPQMQLGKGDIYSQKFKRLNFLNFKSIQEKQMHGYNILSNF